MTKAEVARKIVEALKEMSLEDVTKLVKEMDYVGMEDEEDENSMRKYEETKEESYGKKESKSESVDENDSRIFISRD